MQLLDREELTELALWSAKKILFFLMFKNLKTESCTRFNITKNKVQGVFQEQTPVQQSVSNREDRNSSVGHGWEAKNTERGFDMKREEDISGGWKAKGNAH